MKCIKSCFLLPQKNDFRMLWKHFIIKTCSCRRREVMLPSLWGTGTMWEETGDVQAAFRHCVSLEWLVPLLWHSAETACVWPGKSECWIAHLMQISAQSHFGRNTLKIIVTFKSLCWWLSLCFYLFSFFFQSCCLNNDKPNHISLPKGQQAATKVCTSYSVRNYNFKSTCIEPCHTTEEANIHNPCFENSPQSWNASCCWTFS